MRYSGILRITLHLISLYLKDKIVQTQIFSEESIRDPPLFVLNRLDVISGSNEIMSLSVVKVSGVVQLLTKNEKEG